MSFLRMESNCPQCGTVYVWAFGLLNTTAYLDPGFCSDACAKSRLLYLIGSFPKMSKKVLYAFFSESSVPTKGSTFWTTLAGERIRATHVSGDMALTDFQRPVTDDYGRVTSNTPAPLPEDLVFAGEVWSDTCVMDPDNLHPDERMLAGGYDG